MMLRILFWNVGMVPEEGNACRLMLVSLSIMCLLVVCCSVVCFVRVGGVALFVQCAF